jgi:AraC-like DNA-binding protein
MGDLLRLSTGLPVRAHNAGLFISRGEGRHADRVIDSHELIFVRQGELGMFEDKNRFQVRAGQTLLLSPGIPHGGTTDYPADLSFYWLHFDVFRSVRTGRSNPCPSAGRGVRKAALAKADVLTVPQYGTVARTDRLAELFHWFLNDQESGRLTPAAADLLLMQILHEVADRRRADLSADRAGAALAARADKLIRTRFDEALQTSMLAQELDCNPDYLGRVYHQSYGCTLTDALHRARLKQARALLLESGMNVNQVAGAVGYSDPGYFRRIFLRQEGISPRAYRRLHARMHINTM